GSQLLRAHWFLAPRKTFERGRPEICPARRLQLRNFGLWFFDSIRPERRNEPWKHHLSAGAPRKSGARCCAQLSPGIARPADALVLRCFCGCSFPFLLPRKKLTRNNGCT